MSEETPKVKTREGSGYLKQLYSTARVTAGSTHSNLNNLTTFLVNFIPVNRVDASELQVRVHFDDEEVKTLAESIKLHGVLQPILVVQDGDRYKVIAGERRLRASKLAGMERIPARVLSTDDKATHEIALRENLDRVDLHPIEEGEGYLSLLESKAYSSHEAIAKSFGKPKSRITECISFTKLPDETKISLMKSGLKNRSLLRELLNIPAELHASRLDAAKGAEEKLDLPELQLNLGEPVTGAIEGVSAVANTNVKETPAFSFLYKVGEKSIAVPSFKWKQNQSVSILKTYRESLQKLMNEIDEVLTRP